MSIKSLLNMLMIVYVDSDTCEWHLNQINNTVPRTNDISEFINVSAGPKLAIFHTDFPVSREFEQRFEQTVDHAEYIAVLCSELHSDSVNFMLNHSKENIKYFNCGLVPTVNQEYWFDWFITTSYFYKKNIDVLEQLDPYNKKPKAFDILLGQPRPHRDFIYRYINNLNYNTQVVMTYMTNYSKSVQEQDSEGWIWGVDGIIPPDYKFKWTVTPVKYLNGEMSLSQVIPIDIYNQTAYSIIAETNFENHYTFFTEKTVKPILAQRLFVALAGQHFLKCLRNIGFQTFDCVVDEEYDNIADQTIRWSMACRQIKYLIEQPQQPILDKIKPIVQHNQQLMLDRDWLREYHSQLKFFLGV